MRAGTLSVSLDVAFESLLEDGKGALLFFIYRTGVTKDANGPSNPQFPSSSISEAKVLDCKASWT